MPSSARARGGHAAEQRQQRRRVGEEAQDGVGGEGERVGEQDRAGGALEVGQARTARPSPRRAPRPSRGTAAPRRRRARRPTPTRRCPSRPRARRRSRRRRRSRSASSGSSISWTASSVASGAARCAPEANTTTRSQERSPSPRAAADAASSAPARASGVVERPVPMWTLTRLTILRRMSPSAGVIALFGPTGVGKTEVAHRARRAAARATGEDPVAVSADALQVYAGLEILTGAAERARSSARLEHRLRRLPARRPRRFSAGALRASSRTPRSTPRSPPGGGRSSSAAPASTCAPRWPSSTCARRRRRRARALDAELHRARPGRAARACWPSARPRPPRASRRATARGSCARSSCSTAASSRRRRRRRLAAVDRPTRATRRCWPALVMDRDALHERIDARVDAMVAAGAIEEVRARRRGRRVARPRARRSASRSCSRGDVEAMKRRTRHYAKRQLTWMRKLPGVAADRRHRPRAGGRRGASCTA